MRLGEERLDGLVELARECIKSGQVVNKVGYRELVIPVPSV